MYHYWCPDISSDRKELILDISDGDILFSPFELSLFYITSLSEDNQLHIYIAYTILRESERGVVVVVIR